ncbi:hypothetical protein IQ241_03755 [Romeria aff. gracilis LEGE 07310]|uniref:Uncharacterized protein n=1 Tax=Vasconcelosia minhoensis LEGE 07310 TaxID=915328 RepID=A0A8J7DKH1_9CYAN|nr:hypothetical protein [Romeria gracilis]MBE9076416.1 hypothetical protein [Romeria aff. gracilis LEGE 07310]
MTKAEQMVMLAEDQLAEYSTDARKIEKLRQKIGVMVPPAQQKQAKADLEAEMPTDFVNKLIADQRQTIALPFWGIAGLGLLFGISFRQPVDFVATVVGGAAAIAVQRRGWKLQAKQLVLQTLAELEAKRPD